MAASPEYDLADLDEDDEPLFADDVDDDDPPPLPPPMPALSQLSQTANSGAAAALRVNSNSAENFGGGVTTIPGGGVATGSGDNEQELPQKKRKPILTLTPDRVFSEKGLPYLEKEFPKIHFKGKGHEDSDLRLLLTQYEHWANSLYPKLTCKDVTDRIEALAKKKEFKSQLVQMRRRSAGRGRGSPPPPSSSERPDDDDSPGGGTGAIPGSVEDGATNGDGDPWSVPERRLNRGDSDEEEGGGEGNSDGITRRRTLGMESDSEVESDGRELGPGPVNGSSVGDNRKRRTRLGSGGSEDATHSRDSSKRIRLGSDSSGEDDESPPNDGASHSGGRQRIGGDGYGDELEQDRGQRSSSGAIAGRRLRLDSDSSEGDHGIAADTGRRERPAAMVDLDNSSEDNCSPLDRSNTCTAGNGKGAVLLDNLQGPFSGESDSDSEQELQIDVNRDPEQDSNPAPSDDDD